MDSALEPGGPAGDDREHADDDGDREQDDMGRAETQAQIAAEPDGGEGERRNGQPMLAIAEPRARLRLV